VTARRVLQLFGATRQSLVLALLVGELRLERLEIRVAPYGLIAVLSARNAFSSSFSP